MPSKRLGLTSFEDESSCYAPNLQVTTTQYSLSIPEGLPPVELEAISAEHLNEYHLQDITTFQLNIIHCSKRKASSPNRDIFYNLPIKHSIHYLLLALGDYLGSIVDSQATNPKKPEALDIPSSQ